LIGSGAILKERTRRTWHEECIPHYHPYVRQTMKFLRGAAGFGRKGYAEKIALSFALDAGCKRYHLLAHDTVTLDHTPKVALVVNHCNWPLG
jgi:hypothetical protein